MPKQRKFYVNGRWKASRETYQLRNPYHQKVIAIICRAGKADVEEAIRGAVKAFEVTRRYSGAERAAILSKIIAGLEYRKGEIARAIALEAGKCLKHADAEVARTICTFTIAMEEAKRCGGEILPLDILSANKGRMGLVRRFPIGPVSGISSFNFPLNLVSHKLAPAIAVGCPFILKPATQTPLSALLLAEIVHESGLEPGAFSVVTAGSKDAAALVEDPRIRKLTFTGSPRVGWELKRRCGQKRITLELGGNAAAIIHKDADLKWAVPRCIMGGFSYQGQICIHLQRALVHESLYGRFKSAFVKAALKLKMGDPLNPATDIGPIIDINEAKRIEAWVEEARNSGAKILCGGKRQGSFYPPTIIERCDPRQKVSDEEVFGPVVVLHPFRTFNQALRMVNDSRYGLQAGVFTRDLHLAWQAYEELDVGGVVINDVPTFRSDNQPYGGVKESGFGREGVRFAMDEMTEVKILSLNLGVS
jgi:acyl-CoA reductase-like NAD-dependent aldehyde dehydrogenase